ncbi:hypothetical protein ZTR_03692 [Talaromyces verruculosus]|nr:hypothetical protein ZTR_03692 [Talaromyces verruculosus]
MAEITQSRVVHANEEHDKNSGSEFPQVNGEDARPPPRGRPEWGWMLETIACVCGVGTLIAIFIILRAYNGRALDDWPYSITINTIISILVAVLRAFMAIPLAEGLAQLKWSWFRHEHPLSDFEALNAASTSMKAAAVILLRFLPRHLVSLGSFVLLAGVAIGPFAQQVISIKGRLASSDSPGSIPICDYNQAYDDWGDGAGPGMNLVPLDTIGSIYEGLLQAPNRNNISVIPSCSSGNCTFGDYQSLGFCSKCADISSQMIPQGDCDNENDFDSECILRLPPSPYELEIDITLDTTINATTDWDLLELDVTDLPVIVNFTALTSPANKTRIRANARATECTLYFCVATYHSNIDEGRFTEETISTATITNKTLGIDWDPNAIYSASPATCVVNGVQKQPPYHDGDGCTYPIRGISGMAMANSLVTPLTGSGGQTGSRATWTSDTIHVLENMGVPNIENVFDSLAKVLTIHARSQKCNGGTANGTAWIYEPYIRVQWPWMVLPTVVVMLNLLFFLATVVMTRGQYIWKSSALPLLFLEFEGGVSLQDDQRLRHMEDLSKEINVQLSSTDGGMKLVARSIVNR